MSVSIASLAIAIFLMFFPKDARAADWSITCSQSACTPTNSGSFLPNTPWMPGQTVSRTIEVANHSNSQRMTTLRLSGLRQTKNLVEVIQVRLANNSNHRTIWSGSLTTLLRLKSVELSKVDFDQTATYQLQLTVDKAAGNQYQQAQLSFDLDVELTEVAESASTTTASTKVTSKQSASSNRTGTSTNSSGVEGLSLQRFFGNLVTGSLSLPDSTGLIAKLSPATATQAVAGQLGSRSGTWIWILLVEVLVVYVAMWKLRDRKLLVTLALITLIPAISVAWLTRSPLPVILASIPGCTCYVYISNARQQVASTVEKSGLPT